MTERVQAYVRRKEAVSLEGGRSYQRTSREERRKANKRNRLNKGSYQLSPNLQYITVDAHPYSPNVRLKNTIQLLSKTPGEILATEPICQRFPAPPQITGNPERRHTGRYCEFHQDKGHNTDDCFRLRKHIEEAVHSGELQHLLTETQLGPRQRGGSPEASNQRGKIKEVHMIMEIGGGAGQQKKKEGASITSRRNKEVTSPTIANGSLGRTPGPKTYAQGTDKIICGQRSGIQAKFRKTKKQLQGFSKNMIYPAERTDSLPYKRRIEVITTTVKKAQPPYGTTPGKLELPLPRIAHTVPRSLGKFPTLGNIITARTRGETECRKTPWPPKEDSNQTLVRKLIRMTQPQSRDDMGRRVISLQAGKTLLIPQKENEEERQKQEATEEKCEPQPH